MSMHLLGSLRQCLLRAARVSHGAQARANPLATRVSGRTDHLIGDIQAGHFVVRYEGQSVQYCRKTQGGPTPDRTETVQ